MGKRKKVKKSEQPRETHTREEIPKWCTKSAAGNSTPIPVMFAAFKWTMMSRSSTKLSIRVTHPPHTNQKFYRQRNGPIRRLLTHLNSTSLTRTSIDARLKESTGSMGRLGAR